MNKTELISKFAQNEEDRYILAGILDREGLRTNRNIISGTKFLTERMQTIASAMLDSIGSEYLLFGGFEAAERKLFVFLPDYCSSADIPSNPEICDVSYLEIAADRFFKDSGLTHRDYLGSLLGLGIGREMLGDIIVSENSAQIICLSSAAEIISGQLVSVGKCRVSVSKTDKIIFSENMTSDCICNVSSLRLDSVVSSAFGIPRSRAAEAIEAGLVTVSGMAVTKTDYNLSQGERISLRGKGKVIFAGISNETKKGRLNILIKKFV